MVKVVWQICCMRCSFDCLPYEWQSGTSDGIFSYQSIPLGACLVVLCFDGEVDFCNKYMSSFWLMWVHGHMHTHPFTLLAFIITAQLSPVLKPLFTFIKTATIPTYHGISISIPRYIAMQLSTIPFIMTCFIIVILLFAWSCSWHRICGKATFIIFIHVAIDSLHIPVHRRRHSYRVISCSSFEL